MNSLIANFKTLCSSNITLPDYGDITVEHLNVDFQNSLYEKIRNHDSHITVALDYIRFLNNHILSLSEEKQFTYKDKLYLLNHWKADLTNDENDITYNFNDTSFFKDSELILNIKDGVLLKFTTSNILYENTILDYLLDTKPNNTETDLVFFDNFRFIESITINNKEYIFSDLTLEELYHLYLLFDINNLQQISTHINKQLGDLNSIRSQEADFSFFIDL